jgi:MFS family permease
MRPPRFISDAAGADANAGRVLAALSAAVFVQWMGASAVLPLLPLYLRRSGTSPAMVGAVMSAFFFAGVFTQYLAGHLTDRTGPRRVLVGSLVVFALASAAFVAAVGSGGYLVLRGLQGIGAGGAQVATLALVGATVPDERRGRAFSIVIGAQTAGMAVGPLGGSLVGVANLRWLFLVTAAASAAAIAPAILGTEAVRDRPVQDRSAVPFVINRRIVGVVTAAISIGFIIGVYEVCWSLLMRSRGASAWQIGLSWTLFCIPFAVLAPAAGRLVDRFDRRRITAAGLLSSAAFACSYPFIPKVAVLLSLGTLEAVGVACTFPAAQALLTQTLDAGVLGRGQGLFATAETSAIAVAAAVAGALFGVARWLPFVVSASAAAALIPVMLVLTRGLGRAGPEPTPPAAPTPLEPVLAGE